MAEAKQRTVVKKVENAVLYSDGTIRIDKIRCSYPHLNKPYAGKNRNGEDGNPKFGIVGLLPKETHKAAKDLIKEVIEKLSKENDTKVATDKWFLRDGDQSDKPENEGMFTVSAREARRPNVRDRDGSVMDPAEIADKIYGGCWVNILIRPWYQDGVKIGAGYGKRMNAGLVAVQFFKDDEPFGEGRINDEGVFDSTGEDGFSDGNSDDGL